MNSSPNVSPAVVIKSKFIVGGKSKTSFNNYLNYMDRAETHTGINEFESYQDYMSNEEKSTGLFTLHQDKLSKDEKKKYKDLFKKSQEKGSNLWQDVISFDNDWLKENGVLKGNNIDNKKIQQATRQAVNEMLKKEGLIDSAVWTGAIHYNTENIHVHVAIVQTKDFKERGKRKQGSIDSMKSKVVNTIMDRSKQNEKLNEFIRDKVIGSKQKDSIMSLKNRVVNRDMVKQFKKIHSLLPDDKRMWKYNMNAIQHVRPEIDKLTKMYIQKNFKVEYKEFEKQIDKEVELHKKTYGNSARSKQYKETKMNDLYARMGNTILKEVREYDKQLNDVTRKKGGKFFVQRDLNNAMFMMNRYMKDDLQTFKNQRSFEELHNEKDLER